MKDKINAFYPYKNVLRVTPRGIVAKVQDFDIVVSEFKLQSRYQVHFQINTLEKGMNLLIPPAMD